MLDFFFSKFLFTRPIPIETPVSICLDCWGNTRSQVNFSASSHIPCLVVMTSSGGRERCRSPSIGHDSQLQGLHLHDASSPKGCLLTSCPVIRRQGRNPEDPFRLQQYLCPQMANVIFYESRWVPQIFKGTSDYSKVYLCPFPPHRTIFIKHKPINKSHSLPLRFPMTSETIWCPWHKLLLWVK